MCAVLWWSSDKTKDLFPSNTSLVPSAVRIVFLISNEIELNS